MRRLLVLRPEPGASATIERARQRGLEAVAMPLFEIEAVEWTAPDPSEFDALLVTSANAVRCGGDGLGALLGLPALAVGEATAEAARAAGFSVEATGQGRVDALLASLNPDLNLLHLCGEHRKAPSDAKRNVTAIPVYRSKEKAVPNVADAEGSIALIHSARAGSRFAALIDEAGIDRGSIAIAAISATAADAVGSGWQAVRSRQNPGDEPLLVLAAELCNNPRGT
jgi:uroporphyrinogen-III synthase